MMHPTSLNELQFLDDDDVTAHHSRPHIKNMARYLCSAGVRPEPGLSASQDYAVKLALPANHTMDQWVAKLAETFRLQVRGMHYAAQHVSLL